MTSDTPPRDTPAGAPLDSPNNAVTETMHRAPGAAEPQGDALSSSRETFTGEARSAGDGTALPDRYRDLRLLGSGGFGEVRRVFDTRLERVVAMKLLRPDIAEVPKLQRRFLAEVKLTAGLHHPGIIAIHDYGELDDGRLWFTMPEVRGRTLRDVVDEVFAPRAERRGADPAVQRRRLLDLFARVCEAVAYAHSRGVIHRDLKPENVMVGEFGEVMVMDWGIARRVGRDADEAAPRSREPLSDEPSHDGLTQVGDIMGTPAYMPPEQALGEIHRLGPATDVYALGAILHHLLVGRPPFEGGAIDIWRRVVGEGPPALGERDAPAELAAICARAMAREPERRYAHAGELAAEIEAFLSGARRREHALEKLTEALARAPEIAERRARAQKLRAEAAVLLSPARPFESGGDQVPRMGAGGRGRPARPRGRARRDGLDRGRPRGARDRSGSAGGARSARPSLPGQARRGGARAAPRGRRALRGAPARARSRPPRGVPERQGRAHAGDRSAGREGRPGAVFTQEAAARARDRGRAGPHAARGRAFGEGELQTPYLRAGPGGGGLSGPDRARGAVGRLPAGERRSVPHPAPARRRDRRRRGVRPRRVVLDGGDPDAPDSLPAARLWIDGFVIGRFPVTNEGYLAFLNDLVASGRGDEALAACPRANRGTTARADEQLSYDRSADGSFRLKTDDVAEVWTPRGPVVLVSWHGSVAFTRWLAQRTGRPYRLPHELEREKAVRGADGRFYPWGDFFDPTWACVLTSHSGETSRVDVDAYPLDESPHGLRGGAGNSRDFCGNLWTLEGPAIDRGRLVPDEAPPGGDAYRSMRGGAWSSVANHCRAAARFANRPTERRSTAGLRTVRSFP